MMFYFYILFLLVGYILSKRNVDEGYQSISLMIEKMSSIHNQQIQIFTLVKYFQQKFIPNFRKWKKEAEQLIPEGNQQILDCKKLINELELQAVTQKQKYNEDIKQIQDYQNQKAEENTKRIYNLQQQLDDWKKQEIERQVQQMKIEKLELEMKVNIPKNLDEIIKLLESYQDKANQLEHLKNDYGKAIQEKSKSVMIQNKKKDALAIMEKKMKECKESLEKACSKLQEKELELNGANEKHQKELQIIYFLKTQIQNQKKQLDEFGKKVEELQFKLEQSEKQAEHLKTIINSQNDDLEQLKQKTEELIQESQREQKQILEQKFKSADLENQIKIENQLSKVKLQEKDSEIEILKQQMKLHQQNFKKLMDEKIEIGQQFQKGLDLVNQIKKFQQSLEFIQKYQDQISAN